MELTQEEMAEKLNIGQQALSHLESGRNLEMSYGVFKNLVQKCGVNPYYFLLEGGKEPEFVPRKGNELTALRKKIKSYDKLVDQLLYLRNGEKLPINTIVNSNQIRKEKTVKSKK